MQQELERYSENLLYTLKKWRYNTTLWHSKMSEPQILE